MLEVTARTGWWEKVELTNMTLSDSELHPSRGTCNHAGSLMDPRIRAEGRSTGSDDV